MTTISRAASRKLQFASRGGDRGQNLVELALVMPILILILVGLVDLGRMFNAYIVITNAARVGARYGSEHPTDVAGIRTWVKNDALGAGITLTDANIVRNCYTLNCLSGESLSVQVSCPVQPILGLIWGTGPLTIQTVVWMVIL
jgi:hypothetical protein